MAGDYRYHGDTHRDPGPWFPVSSIGEKLGDPVRAPPPSHEYRDRLARLECHFLWCPEGDRSLADMQMLIPRLQEHVEDEPYTKKAILALIGYIHAKGRYYKKAIDTLDRADAVVPNPVHFDMTCSYVVRANRLHVLHAQGKEDPYVLNQLEKSWRDKAGGPAMEADILGTKAMACTWFTRKKLKEALQYFSKARVLYEVNPHWAYGEARVRRLLREGDYLNQAEVESIVTTEKCLSKVINLTEDTNALYLAEHALCLAEYHKVYTIQSGLTEEGLKQRAAAGAARAKANARGRQEVYKLCAATYKRLGLLQEEKTTLQEGITRCERNWDLYQALGAYCANLRTREHQERALVLLHTAVSNCPPPGHARASLDLLRLRAMMDEDTRLGSELLELEKKFPLSDMDKQYNTDFAQLRTLCRQRLDVEENHKALCF